MIPLYFPLYAGYNYTTMPSVYLSKTVIFGNIFTYPLNLSYFNITYKYIFLVILASSIIE